MSHSPFPYYIDPHVPTAVFDANGWKFAATTPGQIFPEIDPETAADNAALIAAIPEMVRALEEIGRQNLSHEMEEGRAETADFEGAYHSIVKITRAVLASIGKTP